LSHLRSQFSTVKPVTRWNSATLSVTRDRRAFGPHFGTSLAGIEILRLRDALRRVVGLPLG